MSLIIGIIVGLIISIFMYATQGQASARVSEAGANAVSLDELESDDSSTLCDLGYGSYSWTAYDRDTKVAYVIVRSGGSISVTPRISRDGSVMTVE
ncbi:MAG: hypothetical protein WAY93_07050 [Atopobiaceae bacterium]|nr:hypothetical protein [Atopobiaceae bacterium]